MTKTRFITRPYDPAVSTRLVAEGYSRPVAQALAGRNVISRSDMDTAFSALVSPKSLPGAERAAQLLADALMRGDRVAVVGDYDCDGATACTVALRGLTMIGFSPSRLCYFVPRRLDMGYGLSPVVVDTLCEENGKPDLIVTVDNGTTSFEGVARCRELGIRVIITDHHLTGRELPEADCFVNPSAPGSLGCPLLRNLAGVGVFFYVLIALRSELRSRGLFSGRPEPNLASLLDLVALGTVADVVPLDRNNRILVAQGIRRLRAGRGSAGLGALFSLATQNRRPLSTLSVKDLGFALAPRINAAGRISSMDIGIECLLSGPDSAMGHAQRLEAINQQRKDIEQGMQAEAQELLEHMDLGSRKSLVLYHKNWHQGLVGLISSRIKEQVNRPVIAFADVGEGLLRGSGRSVPGLQLRDALESVNSTRPGMLLKFGGHALAAGLTIRKKALEDFSEAFEETVKAAAGQDTFTQEILVDGALSPEEFTFRLIHEIDSIVWGQNFEAPLFANTFHVVHQQLLRGGEHLRALVETGGQTLEAVFFRHGELLPETARLAFRPDVNEWQGRRTLQLLIENMEE